MKLKNAYTNSNERVSFAVEIIKCDINEDSTCKTELEIEGLLNELYFTLYYLKDHVNK